MIVDVNVHPRPDARTFQAGHAGSIPVARSGKCAGQTAFSAPSPFQRLASLPQLKGRLGHEARTPPRRQVGSAPLTCPRNSCLLRPRRLLCWFAPQFARKDLKF
jgi:hypothetical protein